MDANVVIDVGIFDPGTDILEPLHDRRAHLLLADGVLTLADFEGTTAQGKLVGYLQLDGRGKEALWTADLRLLGVDLAHWLRLKRSGDAPPYLSGKLDALVKVKGTGRSAAEILASLDGDLRMHMRDAADLAPRRRSGGDSTSPRRSALTDQGRRGAADPVQRRRPRRRQGRRPAEGVRRQHRATRRSGSTARCRSATRASTCARWSRRRTSAR